MKEGIVLYLIFLQSPTLDADIKKLARHSEFHPVGKSCVAYLNKLSESKTTIEVRDTVIDLLGDDALVIVINARDASAAWYLESEDSEWLKQYI